MRTRAVIAYCLLLFVAMLPHVLPFPLPGYLLSLYMVAVPVVMGPKISFAISRRHLGLGLIVSLICLAPVFVFFSLQRAYHFMGLQAMLSQLLLIAIPEELFFRGFLQQTFGNNYRGIVLVSVLFAVAHIPAFFFYKDAYVLLTFFPSLVMGFLYMRTGNLLPPVLFHFLANVVYRGFMI